MYTVLVERMNEDLLRLKIMSNDEDYVTQLRTLNNKVDLSINKTNEMNTDYQQQYNKWKVC